MNNELITEFMQDYNKHRSAVLQCITLLTRRGNDTDIDYISRMMARAFSHDKSKEYNYNEFEGYINMAEELKGVEYGSDQYKKIMAKYSYVIELHYKNNDHHPKHFKNGFSDMNKYQKDEMYCDWVGSMVCRNTLDGFEKSILINKELFNIPDDEWNKDAYPTLCYLRDNINK
jgi:hypothetical protein